MQTKLILFFLMLSSAAFGQNFTFSKDSVVYYAIQKQDAQILDWWARKGIASDPITKELYEMVLDFQMEASIQKQTIAELSKTLDKSHGESMLLYAKYAELYTANEKQTEELRILKNKYSIIKTQRNVMLGAGGVVVLVILLSLIK
jgi:uncharacterized protein with von Willebrand factor type A (vWA) domain